MEARISVSSLIDGERVGGEYDGTYGFDGNAALLRYTERGAGLEGTAVTLSFTPERLEIRREGAVSMELLLIPGRDTAGMYSTPFGSIPVTARARRLRGILGAGGGRIEAEYSMTVGGAGQENRLTIKIGSTPERNHEI